MKDLDPERMHERYQIQANWTAAIRAQLLRSLTLQTSHRVLEVGSGTGVIIGEIGIMHECRTFGLDIDTHALQFAHTLDNQTRFTVGDGANLPFSPATFDAAICHFLLLWLESPSRVLSEMKRVTRPGGWVLAMAEPDYGGRIDHPPEVAELGRYQEEALQRQGCDTRIGRRLRALLKEQGLEHIRIGVLGADWQEDALVEMQDSEWQMLTHDLEGVVSPDELHDLRQLDQKAWVEGTRFLYVPTFFGGGRVPQ